MIFADTSILLYAADDREGVKHEVAANLLREAVASRSLVLSTQVLQEFYVNAVRKKILRPEHAAGAMQAWARNEIVGSTPELLVQAAQLHQRLRISFWDALIVQAALQAGCTTLYTEDLQHGQRVAGLEIVNPFAHEVHEARARYLTVSTAEAVDQLLRQAIGEKRLVSLSYEGRPKEGEPHDYGVRNGKLRLNFYQTGGRSRSGVEEAGVWKTLDTGKIEQLRLTERHFAGTRPTVRGAHKVWDELFATVTPR